MIRLCIVWGISLGLHPEPQNDGTHHSFGGVSQALLRQFDKFDLVALGESHNTREDQDLRISLRISLVRNPQFPKKVRNIVVECGNPLFQRIASFSMCDFEMI
jgi:hypothetical protein